MFPQPHIVSLVSATDGLGWVWEMARGGIGIRSANKNGWLLYSLLDAAEACGATASDVTSVLRRYPDLRPATRLVHFEEEDEGAAATLAAVWWAALEATLLLPPSGSVVDHLAKVKALASSLGCEVGTVDSIVRKTHVRAHLVVRCAAEQRNHVSRPELRRFWRGLDCFRPLKAR